ncbi:MAG: hypothetical protein EA370_15020 [Wenzhouxiangella sp.]|nr:MAG: hypothetical protein EA370_15020 [Wenzhouxiangella sp.]
MYFALLRLSLLCLLALAWFYGSSVFAPWAESAAPRIWLYDLLLYSGFALYLWGLGEAIWLLMLRRGNRAGARQLGLAAMLLAFAGMVGLAHHVIHHTGLGWDLRVNWSSAELENLTRPGYSDQRQRIGWLLIDTVRAPCEIEPWLWLGRPFGAGSGINRALVFSPGSVPLSPHPSGLAFVAVNGRWWMAYQNPDRFHREPGLAPNDCRPGVVLRSHRQGERFIGG